MTYFVVGMDSGPILRLFEEDAFKVELIPIIKFHGNCNSRRNRNELQKWCLNLNVNFHKLKRKS